MGTAEQSQVIDLPARRRAGLTRKQFLVLGLALLGAGLVLGVGGFSFMA